MSTRPDRGRRCGACNRLQPLQDALGGFMANLSCKGSRVVLRFHGSGCRMAAMALAATVVLGTSNVRAGILGNFEGTGATAADPTFDYGVPNSNGYVPDPGTAATVTLTPDASTASQ